MFKLSIHRGQETYVSIIALVLMGTSGRYILRQAEVRSAPVAADPQPPHHLPRQPAEAQVCAAPRELWQEVPHSQAPGIRQQAGQPAIPYVWVVVD